MKKLTLDQLEVENFAIKLTEAELTNLKGATCCACGLSALAVPANSGPNGLS